MGWPAPAEHRTASRMVAMLGERLDCLPRSQVAEEGPPTLQRRRGILVPTGVSFPRGLFGRFNNRDGGGSKCRRLPPPRRPRPRPLRTRGELAYRGQLFAGQRQHKVHSRTVSSRQQKR